MMRMSITEAKGLKADGAFSFVDGYGTRATRLYVCTGEVITAASCVDFQRGAFLITASVVPL